MEVIVTVAVRAMVEPTAAWLMVESIHLWAAETQ